ncbi:MAG: hypothetical protein FWG16_06335, partial [Micrococcales bacterium]|nr:hypothetical protein [Micrococcales bacterium]
MKQNSRLKARQVLACGLAVGLIAGLGVVGGGSDQAQARLQMIMEGEVVADPALGPLTVNFYVYTGTDPCVDGALPEGVGDDDLDLQSWAFLQAGGEWFDQRLFSYGPWVVEVVDSSDASTFQYFMPFDHNTQTYGDPSQVGCFDYFDGYYNHQWMDIGVLTIEMFEAGVIVEPQGYPIEADLVALFDDEARSLLGDQYVDLSVDPVWNQFQLGVFGLTTQQKLDLEAALSLIAPVIVLDRPVRTQVLADAVSEAVDRFATYYPWARPDYAAGGITLEVDNTDVATVEAALFA